jgi:hypothetical protein
MFTLCSSGCAPPLNPMFGYIHATVIEIGTPRIKPISNAREKSSGNAKILDNTDALRKTITDPTA